MLYIGICPITNEFTIRILYPTRMAISVFILEIHLRPLISHSGKTVVRRAVMEYTGRERGEGNIDRVNGSYNINNNIKHSSIFYFAVKKITTELGVPIDYGNDWIDTCIKN